MNDVTVCIPTIPPRTEMLLKAIDSVQRQTRPPDAIAVSTDVGRIGAPRNRDNVTDMVTTELVAYLDDDDYLHPPHLALLIEEMERTGADLVYPWFDVVGGTDPFPQFFGLEWDNSRPHQVPITYLAKIDAIRAVGGFSHDWAESKVGKDQYGNRAGEDYRLMLRMADCGFNIVHLPVRTWVWNHHGQNTSGRPGFW